MAVLDKRTVKQKLADAAAKKGTNPQVKAPDTNEPVNGGLGGQPATPATDVQTVDARGGGLGGTGAVANTTDTKTVAQRGGGLASTGNKQKAGRVIDKRTVKEKMKDAQSRRNGG